MTKSDLTMDFVAKMLAEYEKSEVAAEEHHVKEEECCLKEQAAAKERCLKAKERAQHMELLEMLHEGKISQDMYEAMKP
jgi:hypothetical protein